STRTLQRRLSEEGTSFQSVLNATRESLARHYLVNGGLAAGEIAFLLGYEEPSSFYRAFHSWTGQTPERVRAEAR
ncbi:MAG: helix-turn-helix domain-containing protein, partial [Actinomycetota bacterium]